MMSHCAKCPSPPWALKYHPRIPHPDLVMWQDKEVKWNWNQGLGFGVFQLPSSCATGSCSCHLEPPFPPCQADLLRPDWFSSQVWGSISSGIWPEKGEKLWSALSTRKEGILLIINQGTLGECEATDCLWIKYNYITIPSWLFSSIKCLFVEVA